MIGFFDSGFGGLQTMKYFYDLYPDYDYVFLADNKNCPFGEKNGDEIQKITFDALNWFFDNGAKLVIIACNTAAAYSIRKRQELYPQKKTLSITVPGVEEIINNGKDNGSIGVLATKATVMSDIYNDLYQRFGGKGSPGFNFVMAPKLVDMVESGVNNDSQVVSQINDYLLNFPNDVSTLILGCTHFSVYKKYFEKLFSGKIIDPSYYSAKKFTDYLKRHSEIKKNLSKKGNINFFTTGNVEHFNKIGSKIRGFDINSKQIIL
ncbi:MAG TPA: glutamate racemase [Candidatus Absconditabacterales bacterium]|nr:glutamate racemase [Candidatus Absconditabacterales bacterium]